MAKRPAQTKKKKARATRITKDEGERHKSAFYVFAVSAHKYGIVTPELISMFYGMTATKAKAVHAGDLTSATWEEYISMTARIIFWRFRRGR